MSGGCYNYLCHKNSVEEIFTEEEYLNLVRDDLIKYNYKDIASDVDNLLKDINDARVKIEGQLEKLNQVFKAVEWYESNDYGRINLINALEEYRKNFKER